MSSEQTGRNRSYRRGAIMGLTMAEAFILISFALLLLFAFWQWEIQKENTSDVRAFKGLTDKQRQIVLLSAKDGSLDAFASLKKAGVDFSVPASMENPKDKWRFIDKDELLRLMDATSRLPDDVQRDLADLVQDPQAQKILSEMGALEELVKAGRSISDLLSSDEMAAAIKTSGKTLEELLAAAKMLDTINKSGQDVKAVLAAAQAMEDLRRVGQTLEGISGRIRNAEAQRAALVGTLRTKLGTLVSEIGGSIDETGAITLPDTALFRQGKSQITPVLATFLRKACGPWLTTLKNSGIKISEVRIEGHASSEWRNGSSPRAAYLGNLYLSQQRSQAVSRTCLDFVRDRDVLEWARKHLVAVGYSSVRPVVRNGAEDHAASRRVVFSVIPDRKPLLDEIQTQAKIAQYDRSRFGGWVDLDNDCQNTRQELLISQSTSAVTMSKSNCIVVRGSWLGPYTGKSFTKSSEIEIDHLVSLKWAWDHGAYDWSSAKRSKFANDPNNLFPVDVRTNQKKGAKGPLEWLPPSQNFHCRYVAQFRKVVLSYGLQLSETETSDILAVNDAACS